MTVKDRVAVVTGSGSGIGEAIVKMLASRGAKVVINDLDQKLIDQVVTNIHEEGGIAIGIKADVTSQEDVNNMINLTIKKYGRLDILVNNAGISLVKKVTESTIEDWDRVIDTNLKSMFITSKLASPHMINQNYGRIINISSRAWLGLEDFSIYSTSKGGVVSLTRSLALELGKHGITTNTICPGIVSTPLFESTPENTKNQLKSTQPTRRIGKPEDIARGVLFFAEDESDYITGQTLFICGGRSIFSSLTT